MGMFIKGFTAPKGCGECLDMCLTPWCRSKLRDFDDPYEYKPPDCRYTDVPAPHGRLIDADVLMKEFEKAQRTMAQHGQEYSCSFMSSSQELSTEWHCVEDILENAPTIIEAEQNDDVIWCGDCKFFRYVDNGGKEWCDAYDAETWYGKDAKDCPYFTRKKAEEEDT